MVICETPAGTVYEPDVAVVVNVTVVANALTVEAARKISTQKTWETNSKAVMSAEIRRA
jgi:hypothetical protein